VRETRVQSLHACNVLYTVAEPRLIATRRTARAFDELEEMPITLHRLPFYIRFRIDTPNQETSCTQYTLHFTPELTDTVSFNFQVSVHRASRQLLLSTWAAESPFSSAS